MVNVLCTTRPETWDRRETSLQLGVSPNEAVHDEDTYPSKLLVDPDVKARIEAKITEAKQEISLLSEERKEIEAELAKVDEEDKIFRNKLVKHPPFFQLDVNWFF